ncbi:MAG: hypothetical protein ACK5P5_13055 [Pseudobdellovibrionaceae bacterium]
MQNSNVNIQKNKTLAFHLGFLMLMSFASLAGCGGSSTTNADVPLAVGNPGVVPPIASCPSGFIDMYGNCGVTDEGTSNPTNTSGSTVAFNISNFNDFNSYVATRPLNNPTDVKITVQLQNVGELRYGGKVAISYLDNNIRYQGWLESGLGQNSTYKINSRDDGKYEAQFNYWFPHSGKTVYSGFFQDTIGAVVLVIDGTQNQGDGQGGGLVSGSLWYKNFAQVLAPQGPMRKCWFISLGPYDCRSGTVISKTGLYPSDGYKLLGTFSGLNMNRAFGL